MKKLVFLLVMILALSMAVPAMSQDNGPDIDTSYKYADWAALLVAKAKAILELELLLKTKRVDIFVDIDLVGDQAAETGVFIKAINDNVGACDFCNVKDATLDGSIVNNTGTVQTNQASGHINNQANVIAISVDSLPGGGTAPAGTKESFTESQVVLEQANLNSMTITYDSDLTASILNSINSNTGVVQFNQNASNVNNQHNIIAVAVGVAAVALNEVALGQVNANLKNGDLDVTRLSYIGNSINSNTGVVQVNQNTGTLNNQANIVSLSGTGL